MAGGSCWPRKQSSPPGFSPRSVYRPLFLYPSLSPSLRLRYLLFHSAHVSALFVPDSLSVSLYVCLSFCLPLHLPSSFVRLRRYRTLIVFCVETGQGLSRSLRTRHQWRRRRQLRLRSLRCLPAGRKSTGQRRRGRGSCFTCGLERGQRAACTAAAAAGCSGEASSCAGVRQ